MSNKHSLRGTERRVVSVKLYRDPEFVNFKRICDAEGKSVNAKLRELIINEINEKLGGVLEE